MLVERYQAFSSRVCRFCISTLTRDTSRHAFAVLVPSMKISAVVADFEIRYGRQAAPFIYRKVEALGGSRCSREQVRPTRVKGRECSAPKDFLTQFVSSHIAAS